MKSQTFVRIYSVIRVRGGHSAVCVHKTEIVVSMTVCAARRWRYSRFVQNARFVRIFSKKKKTQIRTDERGEIWRKPGGPHSATVISVACPGQGYHPVALGNVEKFENIY